MVFTLLALSNVLHQPSVTTVRTLLSLWFDVTNQGLGRENCGVFNSSGRLRLSLSWTRHDLSNCLGCEGRGVESARKDRDLGSHGLSYVQHSSTKDFSSLLNSIDLVQ